MRSNRSARAILDELTTEAEFQAQVLELARYCGWKAYHTHDSRRSQSGFPDLILAKPGHPILAWELKRVGEKATDEQQEWIDTLATATGVHAAVLWPHPEHWQYIERTLKGAQRERPPKPE